MGISGKISNIRKLLTIAFFLSCSWGYAQQINLTSLVKNNPDGSQSLLNHVPRKVTLGLAAKTSSVNSNQMLDLRIIMPSRDQAGLDNLIQNLYNPKSPLYHKFLTTQQFNQQYGASQVDTPIVINYLQSLGLTVKSRSNNGFILTVTGPVSKIGPAFKVNINNYKGMDGKMFFAPDSNPTIPPQVAGKIYAIVGLDNLMKIHPHYHQGNRILAKNASVSPAVKHNGIAVPKMIIKPLVSPPAAPTGLTAVASASSVILYWNASSGATSYNVYSSSSIAGPFNVLLASGVTTTNFQDYPESNGIPVYYEVAAIGAGGQSGNSGEASATPVGFLGYGGFLGPSDIADAYNLKSLSSNGSGQTLGLYELDGYTRGDITTFEGFYALPNVTLTNIYTDGAPGTPGPDSGEVTLDIEIAVAVAPGLSSIRVYEAPPLTTYPSGWIDQWDAIINDPSHPNIISLSYGGDELNNYFAYDHSVFSELAAVGVTVFASSGDSGAYDNCDGGTNPPNCTVDQEPASGVLSVDDPASDPYVTGVGISILKVNNAGSSSMKHIVVK